MIDIFHAARQPINVGVVWNSKEAARQAPTADITLAYCCNCSFVFNRIFDLSKVVFEPGYEVALTHSAIFREYITKVVDRLVHRYHLYNKKIFEIGCGAGYFLRLICERGGNHGVGIDPTTPHEGVETLERGSVEFIRDFYHEKHVNIESDFVCCLSVFEDVPKPTELLKTVRRMIGEERRTPVYFEVFNAFRAIQQRETWSIHYEQCNYFSLDTLTKLFERCGFEIFEAGTCYQDAQYLYVEALPAATQSLQLPQKRSLWPENPPDEIASFSRTHIEKVNLWEKRLTNWKREQRRVVVWGTGGKGISFLNALPTEGVIEYVVDINPDKHGKYVPGAGQRIVSPEFLAKYNPDYVIITNPLYQKEMQQQANQLGVRPEFLVA